MIIIERNWDIDNPRGGYKMIHYVKRRVFNDDDTEGVQKFLDEEWLDHEGRTWYNVEYKYTKL